MTRAFVTGANGHIGSNLVRDLVEHGYEVTAFVREGSDRRGLEGLAVTMETGDVLDEGAVRLAMKGADVVFHLAAPYKLWAKEEQSIVDTAVKGTENVLRAAKENGIRRVVVTSSCNAVGFTTDESKPRDETSWNERTKSPYIRAKNEQERRAFALGKELGLEVITVLPTTVLGPNDWRKTPTTGPFVDALRGKGPVPCAFNLVDVRDVARCHVLAAEKGRPGERYLAGGENVSAKGIADLIEKHTGKRPPVGLPPLWLVRTLAALAEATAPLTGKQPFITRAVLDDAVGGHGVFDCTKAKTELGLEARGAEEVILATIAWAKKMEWLPNAASQAA